MARGDGGEWGLWINFANSPLPPNEVRSEGLDSATLFCSLALAGYLKLACVAFGISVGALYEYTSQFEVNMKRQTDPYIITARRLRSKKAEA